MECTSGMVPCPARNGASTRTTESPGKRSPSHGMDTERGTSVDPAPWMPGRAPRSGVKPYTPASWSGIEPCMPVSQSDDFAPVPASPVITPVWHLGNPSSDREHALRPITSAHWLHSLQFGTGVPLATPLTQPVHLGCA